MSSGGVLRRCRCYPTLNHATTRGVTSSNPALDRGSPRRGRGCPSSQWTDRQKAGRELVLPRRQLGSLGGKGDCAGEVGVVGPGNRVGSPPVIPSISCLNPTDHIAVAGVIEEDTAGSLVSVPDVGANILAVDGLTVGK